MSDFDWNSYYKHEKELEAIRYAGYSAYIEECVKSYKYTNKKEKEMNEKKWHENARKFAKDVDEMKPLKAFTKTEYEDAMADFVLDMIHQVEEESRLICTEDLDTLLSKLKAIKEKYAEIFNPRKDVILQNAVNSIENASAHMSRIGNETHTLIKKADYLGPDDNYFNQHTEYYVEAQSRKDELEKKEEEDSLPF